MSGGGGGGESHTPYVQSDTLRSCANAYVLDALGEGPIEGFPDPQYPEKFIYLNDTPIQNEDGSFNFKKVKVSWRNGYADQEPIAGFPTASSDISSTLGLPAQVKTTQSVTVTVSDLYANEVLLRFALNALQENKSNGDVVGGEVEIKVEAKSSNPGSTWVEVYRGKKKGKASSKYEWTTRVQLDKVGSQGPWLFKMSRITPDSTTQTLINDTFFQGLSVLYDKQLMYPCTALVAVFTDASQFNSVPTRGFHIRGLRVRVPSNYTPPKYDYKTKRWTAAQYNGEWDGSFKFMYTPDPAWCFYDILVENRYGLGDWVKPEMVDKWALYEISQYSNVMVPSGLKDEFGEDILEPRFTLNCYIQTKEEALRVVQSLASNFRAMCYWAAGAVFAAQDRPLDPSYLFVPSNIVGGEFTRSSSARRARHNATAVQWNNPELGYKLDTELVMMDDAVRKSTFLFQNSIVAYGCTSKGQAIRQGKWTLFTENYECDTIAFKAGIEGVQLRPGDIVAVQDPEMIGKSWTGRMGPGSTDSSVVLDREVEIGPEEHHIIIVNKDGTISETLILGSGTNSSFSIRQITEVPLEGAVWAIASTEFVPELYRILNVKVSGNEYEITALFHCPWKFDWVEKDIVIEDKSGWINNIGQKLVPPSGLTLNEYLFAKNTDFGVGVQARWTPGSKDTIGFLPSYRIDSGNWIDLPSTSENSVDIRDVQAPCQFDFCVRGKNIKGEATAPVLGTLPVKGKEANPGDVTGYSVQVKEFQLLFKWTNPTDLDFSSIEMREGEWDTGTMLLKDYKGTSYTCEIGATRSTVFTIKAKDTTGHYSTNAARVVLTISGTDDTDTLSPTRKRELAVQWAIILSEQADLDNRANTYGVNHTAYDNAISAVPTFFSTRNTPKAWTDFSGPTYLGAGGGTQLTNLLKAIATQAESLRQLVALAGMAFNIASGATDAMLKSGFLDGNGMVKWDKIQMAVRTIFSSQLYVANWDNLIPNPNSEQLPPSGGWPSGVFEGAGVVSGNADAGSYCRYVSPYSTLILTPNIPCGEGDQFCFRARVKGTGGQIAVRFNGSVAASATSSSGSYQTKECATGVGAPAGTTYVDFVVTTGSTGVYVDNMYARRMNDGLVHVDGSVKAQHLEAVLALLGEIKSPGQQGGTSIAAPTGFRISGPGFSSTPLGGSPTTVSAEFGRAINVAGFMFGDSMDRLWNAMNRVLNGTISGLTDMNPWSTGINQQGWVEGVDTLYGFPVGYLKQVQNGFPYSSSFPGNEGSLRVIARKGSGVGESTGIFEQSLVLPKPAPNVGATLSIRTASAIAKATTSATMSGTATVFLTSPDAGSTWVGTVNLGASGSGINILSGGTGLTWALSSWDITSIINSGGAGTWKLRILLNCNMTGSSDADDVGAVYADDIKLVI